MELRALAEEASNYRTTLQEVLGDIRSLPDPAGKLDRALASVSELGVEVRRSETGSSAVVRVSGGGGPTVMLLADLDACAAAGVGAIHLLRTHDDQLAGDVLVEFEGSEAGTVPQAPHALVGVYAVGISPAMPTGSIAVAPGEHAELTKRVAEQMFGPNDQADTSVPAPEPEGKHDGFACLGAGPDGDGAVLGNAAAYLAGLAFARLDELRPSA